VVNCRTENLWSNSAPGYIAPAFDASHHRRRMSYILSDSTLSTFTASDGRNLAVQDWPLPEGLASRGIVLLVHGLGGSHQSGYMQRLTRLLWQRGVRTVRLDLRYAKSRSLWADAESP